MFWIPKRKKEKSKNTGYKVCLEKSVGDLNSQLQNYLDALKQTNTPSKVYVNAEK